MKYFIFDKEGKIKNYEEIKGMNPLWILMYATCDSDYRSVISELREVFSGVDVFGATSFQGVFTPEGFVDGGAFLVCEKEDEIFSSAQMKSANPDNARNVAKEMVVEIEKKLGRKPDVILMHATPGFEERIIEGINDVFKDEVPIYGGSAGDNDISGKWKIFKNDEEVGEGILIAGFCSERKVYGAFLSGYIPTRNKGKITKAEGRIIHEIDGKPAAIVYNEWTKGSISKYLDKGGVILAETTLYPLGRVVGKVVGTPVYLLSHPHMVIPDTKSLSFFTEFKKEGEEVILMSGTKKALIERTNQVASRALGLDKGKVSLKAGILIYCAGCVGAVMENKEEIISEYKSVVGDIPFIGAATFGEQGCFRVEKDKNRHGNLMCDTILFS